LKNEGRSRIEGDFTPAVAQKHMQKDFDPIKEAANCLKTPLFASAIAHPMYTAGNVAGSGDLDYASAVRFPESASAGKADPSAKA